ncbi:hypothetical protein B0I35DRAFT_68360 [Stachybotrys elegans]|uniref:Uncharacterized protein n=1 Tax=Stachybotrys elegans TaxID=80388 RepID=A0A8K0SME4_9HYPO|nr:hypothetical protein B0I35DRAFT_68360 [Stachybotrys elegans]
MAGFIWVEVQSQCKFIRASKHTLVSRQDHLSGHSNSTDTKGARLGKKDPPEHHRAGGKKKKDDSPITIRNEDACTTQSKLHSARGKTCDMHALSQDCKQEPTLSWSWVLGLIQSRLSLDELPYQVGKLHKSALTLVWRAPGQSSHLGKASSATEEMEMKSIKVTAALSSLPGSVCMYGVCLQGACVMNQPPSHSHSAKASFIVSMFQSTGLRLPAALNSICLIRDIRNQLCKLWST